ncbi:hypothetical protein [Chryseolinea soli]|uniref:Uncharacterized protein n=1 Tax=Chryseolinea soli TaxID=2321403 RepID=A0A385SG67_9BACT|nr:hypothetical protein [Chryseolinea soli]AYB29451.1 hypothetical protein D4L85_02125 [Chryseolinea soli]
MARSRPKQNRLFTPSKAYSSLPSQRYFVAATIYRWLGMESCQKKYQAEGESVADVCVAVAALTERIAGVIEGIADATEGIAGTMERIADATAGIVVATENVAIVSAAVATVMVGRAGVTESVAVAVVTVTVVW